MNSTTPSKFPTPTAGGSNKASHGSRCVIKERRHLLGRQTISGVISSPGTQVAATGFDDLVDAKRYKSSKGERLLFIMLLSAAAPAHAAGVCIICPPGHTCPGNTAPVLGGATNQILRRTATGTEWVNASAVQGTQGPQGAAGAQGPAGASGAQGPQGTAGTVGPQGAQGTAGSDANVTRANVNAAIRPVIQGPQSFSVVAHCNNSSTDRHNMTAGRHCWCAKDHLPTGHGIVYRSNWTQVTAGPGGQGCIGSVTDAFGCGQRCLACCKSLTEWHANVRWRD